MLSGSGDCDSGSFFTTVDAFRSELGDGTSLAHPGLVCLDCKKCVAVKVMGGLNWVKPHPAWRTLDDLLNTGDLSKNGWIKAESKLPLSIMRKK